MSMKIFLNLFVEHPFAAVACLLIAGGIIFGILGGIADISFFKTWWLFLVLLGFGVLFLWIIIELAKMEYSQGW